MTSFVDPLRRSGAASLALTNTRNDRIVADTLLRAFDSESRRRGLLKRDFLADGSALVIAPTNAIHTFFMRFAIDVAFVARDGRVLKIRRAMPPWRMAAAWGGLPWWSWPQARSIARTSDRVNSTRSEKDWLWPNDLATAKQVTVACRISRIRARAASTH